MRARLCFEDCDSTEESGKLKKTSQESGPRCPFYVREVMTWLGPFNYSMDLRISGSQRQHMPSFCTRQRDDGYWLFRFLLRSHPLSPSGMPVPHIMAIPRQRDPSCCKSVAWPAGSFAAQDEVQLLLLYLLYYSITSPGNTLLRLHCCFSKASHESWPQPGCLHPPIR